MKLLLWKKITIHFPVSREFLTDSLRPFLALIVYEYSIYLNTFIEYYILSDEVFGVEKHNVWEKELCDNGGHIDRGKLCSVGRSIVVTQKMEWS